MKVKQVKQSQSVSIGLEVTHNAKISAEKMYKLGLMLKNPYRNPISSIVREITSNAYDAHKEAGVKKPIKILFSEDSTGQFISFTDYGTGMSPELIEKVYSQYLQSTKEDTNDQIGYFGIGSKSPLAYNNHFHCITNYNGDKYHYVMRETETLPETILFDKQPTNDGNGTTIKIYFKSNYDVKNFMSAINEQLTYFEDVVVVSEINDSILTSEVQNFNKNFKLYRGKNFQFRENNPNGEMHIVLGTVVYPINWSQLNISPIYIPVGIKINIGDIMVTPNREDIQYTSDVKKMVDNKVQVVEVGSITLIKNKIKEVLNELYDLYNKQNFVIDSIIEFLHRDDNETLYLDNNVSLNLHSLFAQNLVKFKANNFELNGLSELKQSQVKTYISRFFTINKINKFSSKYGVNILKNLTSRDNEYFYCEHLFDSNVRFNLDYGKISVLECLQLGYNRVNKVIKQTNKLNPHRVAKFLGRNNVSDIRSGVKFVYQYANEIFDYLKENGRILDEPIKIDSVVKDTYTSVRKANRTFKEEGQIKVSIIGGYNVRYNNRYIYYTDLIKMIKNLKGLKNYLIVVGHTNDDKKLKDMSMHGVETVIKLTNKKIINALIQEDNRIVHVDDVINGTAKQFEDLAKFYAKNNVRIKLSEYYNSLSNRHMENIFKTKFNTFKPITQYGLNFIGNLVNAYYDSKKVEVIENDVKKYYQIDFNEINTFISRSSILGYLTYDTPRYLVTFMLRKFNKV